MILNEKVDGITFCALSGGFESKAGKEILKKYKRVSRYNFGDLMYDEMEGALKEEWFFVLEINLHYQHNKPVKDKNYLRRMNVPMLNMRERVSIFS